MKKVIVAVMALGMLMAGVVQSAEALHNPGGTGGVESLRGASEIETTRAADPMKRYPRDQGVIDSDYVYQPPLIPHTIRNYEVSQNANKCLACHSWKNAKDMGATKISVTHYQSPRQGQVLSDVSPSRYFCLQCHVPQADAKPLVGNDFQRVDALR
ncbi:periplasmic nitrate reductase, electron transfer subunit [Photobacterium aphoticum]|uniref:Periplasmic nitrate reductase, electron transfer subunit n=2 Tax=Photobacterium aphoticum TaxID=754436 RepID=A0A0J1GS63_9GAMM|nr:nitrate reductase cytochrome c-type subunit [Photobacterium aphoticum]KLV02588.1 nitrate reductase [Photobacterium aphoticum]PSU55056.1 nitrate reductase cytochrome c-type subunit; periplasmic nitrate reductase electron transfer subunit [Photobacterium aphoticum]GHA47094.1 periplasmic nitrate reductase, electron transfer subunit [Photobacterium aphoticum]